MISRMTIVLLLSTVALAAIGCGGSDGDGNATPVPTATPRPASPTPTAPAATPTAPPVTPTAGPRCFAPTLDASLCDPASTTFSLASTNPYYPLVPGLRVVLEGEEDGEAIRVERTVLQRTEVVAGVETHVLEARELVDGELYEVARNYYVEAGDGTVCYFGEDVEFYEDGEVVSTDGSWRAGVDGARPGIIMPARPAVGQGYFQENAPGIALDMGRVSATGASRTIGGVAYDDLVVVQDSNALEDCSEDEKVYAPGLGEIVDNVAQIVPEPGDGAMLSKARLLIEHNATDEDTGFQGFADGDPWNTLAIAGPGDVRIATVTALGGLRDFGLTELFFETSEPENAIVPIDDVLARLDEGDYVFTGDLVGADPDALAADLTHDIPAGPDLVAPVDDATGLDPATVAVAWEGVAEDVDGEPLAVVAYQVIVEEDAAPAFPQGFSHPVMSVHLPASARQVSVPVGFLRDDACYKWEVLAIEASGNQTLSSAAFETGDGCADVPDPDEQPPRLTKAKLLVEHNATDEDTGFQGFADGDPWNELTITAPDGTAIARVTPEGGLFDFGLTELFFETSEPENALVPIDDVLDHLPEGTYTFRGVMVGGGESTLTATLSHDIPAGPPLVSPAPDATDVDPASTVVSWQPVTTDVDGEPLQIVGYQVIVEEDAPPPFPQGFTSAVFSVHLPATATAITVPAEFMRGGTDYKFEVLAIEPSGNQTLSSAAFRTR